MFPTKLRVEECIKLSDNYVNKKLAKIKELCYNDEANLEMQEDEPMPILAPMGRIIDTEAPHGQAQKSEATFRNSREYRAYCGEPVILDGLLIDEELRNQYLQYLERKLK